MLCQFVALTVLPPDDDQVMPLPTRLSRSSQKPFCALSREVTGLATFSKWFASIRAWPPMRTLMPEVVMFPK